MPVEKFSISLPEELAEDIEALANAHGVTRSAIIREAAEAYVIARRDAKRRADRSRRIADAITRLDEVAAAWGADERTALEYLREVRGETAGEASRDE